MFYLFGFSVNVTWFNPPICTNAKAKVGDYLVNLIRNSFTSLIKFSKLFSRNTINRSCNCMPNTKAEKSKHNKNLLEKVQKTSRYPVLQLCNKNQRPLKGQCFIESIIYQANTTMEVSNINNITANIPRYKEKVYLKVSEIIFKVRDGNHKKSFKRAL